MGQLEWETLKRVDWCNTKRPHNAIGYLTPHSSRLTLVAKSSRGGCGVGSDIPLPLSAIMKLASVRLRIAGYTEEDQLSKTS